MDTLIFGVIGVFLGVLSRTLLPYIKRWKAAIDAKLTLPFDIAYLYSALYAVIISGIVTVLVIPNWIPPVGVADMYVFSSAFTFGYTANDIVNEIVS